MDIIRIEDFIEQAQKFAVDTKEWGGLDKYKQYTTGQGNWEESSDNAEGGLDLKWAFQKSKKFIEDNSKNEYISDLCENSIACIDNIAGADDLYLLDNITDLIRGIKKCL